MNLENLKALNGQIAGSSGISVRDVAAQISKELFSMYDKTLDNVDFITIVLSKWNDPSVDLTHDEATLIEEMFANGNVDWSFTTDGFRSIVIRIRLTMVSPLAALVIEQNGVPVCYLKDSHEVHLDEYPASWSYPTSFADGSPNSHSLTEFIQYFTNGSQMTNLFAQISDACANGDLENDAAGIMSIINTYILQSPVSNDIKALLTQANSRGPKSVISTIQQLLYQTNYAATQSEGGDAFSTSFAVSSFSWGLVARAASSIAQVASALLFALSGVAKVITAVAMTAINIIGNIVSISTASAGDAMFTCNHWSGATGFDLVLNQFSFDNQTIAELIRLSGEVCISCSSPRYPAYVMISLSAPENPASTMITVQEIPSANFSFAKYATVSSQTLFDKIVISPHISIQLLQSGVTNPSATLAFLFDKQILDTCDTTGELVAAQYAPIDLDLSTVFSAVRVAATGDLLAESNNTWCERLLTSLILWSIMKAQKIWSPLLSAQNAKALWLPSGYYNSLNPYSDPAINWKNQKHLYMFINSMCYFWIRGFLSTGTYRMLNDVNIPTDDVIKLCQQWFNGLKWHNYINGYEDGLVYGLVDSNDSYSVVTVSDELTAYYFPIDEWQDEWTNFSFIPDDDHLNIFLLNDVTQISPGIPKYAAVHIPRCTVLSVVLGILADIAILAVVGAITIAAIAVSRKIKRKAMRRATDVEAKKYAYENALTGQYEDPVTGEKRPYTREELDGLYKDYYSSKRKYNLFATLTGAPKADQTPFGNFGSEADASHGSATAICGYLTGNENDIPTLATIIKGNDSSQNEITSLQSIKNLIKSD